VSALDAGFYDRPVLQVAQDLVGCVLVHGDCAGVVVETEAYHYTEPACHAYVGLTERTSTLYGPPGIAYVYRSYGIHALLNAVCEHPGVGAAVLIRAVQPLAGIELMRERRRTADAELCNGPGKLTQAFGIGMEHNGMSVLDSGPVAFEPRPPGWEDPEILAATRIGITKAADLPWRFCAAGARDVSRPWPPDFRTTLASSARRPRAG
jgi:DNA-3-methyladenine glycosylase